MIVCAALVWKIDDYLSSCSLVSTLLYETGALHFPDRADSAGLATSGPESCPSLPSNTEKASACRHAWLFLLLINSEEEIQAPMFMWQTSN